MMNPVPNPEKFEQQLDNIIEQHDVIEDEDEDEEEDLVDQHAEDKEPLDILDEICDECDKTFLRCKCD
jgi:hypothetical protein